MSDIIKKYESVIEDFVATEDDLKALLDNTIQQQTVSEKSKVDNSEISLKSNLVVSDDKQTHLETDYNYIRANLYTITERSIDALNSLVDIAQQSQHPRAYEVISLMVNTIAGAQKDLMTIHKDKSRIEMESEKSASGDVVNNNLFIGNTAQLDEIIANMSKKKLPE